jgi:cell division protein FtsQ
MEIKTNRTRDDSISKPAPPDKPRRPKKKNVQKIGKGPIANRRLFSVFKVIGKVFAFLLMIVFMLSVFVYAYTSERFNLHKITVYGCKELSPKQLEEIIRRDFPRNILRIDLHHLKTRLEKEKWAKSVEIRRVLPSDLIIYLQERTPSVIIEITSALMLADSEGILLDAYDARYGKLDVPVFKGALGDDRESYCQYQEENTARVKQALSMLSEIEAGSPAATRNISEVDISDPKNLKVLLVDDTAEVYLGEKDYLKRFQTLMNNINQYQELKTQYDIASVDMRFDGQIVYRPRRNAETPKVAAR